MSTKKTSKKILRVLSEYNLLIKKRRDIAQEIDEIAQFLDIGSKKCANLDEYLSEVDRQTTLLKKYDNIYKRGQKDITSLSEDELLAYTRYEKLINLQKQDFYNTAEILATRQSILNVTDVENSRLSGDLVNKYINTDEFVKFSSKERLVDFIKAYNRSYNPLIELPDSETTAIIVSNPEKFLEVSKDKELHPILRTFVNKLIDSNNTTGYTSGKYTPAQFEFSEGEIEGEILIENPRTKVTPESIAKADQETGLTPKKIGKFKAFLNKIRTTFNNKGNKDIGER